MQEKRLVQDLLRCADVHIDGKRPWDLRVHTNRFYDRVLAQGSLGLGGSYMDGWWDCDAIDVFIDKILRARLDRKVKRSARALWYAAKARVLNLQSRSRAFEVGRRHYDIGNDVYAAMLDSRMAYSCGYWKHAKTLDAAQEAKLDLICQKIGLTRGMRVLDIGCGWGSFAKFAAQTYGAHVVGITISKEQARFARQDCKGLPVEIRLQDYRSLREKFDRIVSVGMFEHVGCKNYRTYLRVAHRNLAKDGLFLLHTIGCNRSVRSMDPWLDKYIFPNSMLPSAQQITAAAEGLFILEDWHNFGPDYDKTLLAWHGNVTKNWSKIKSRYDDRFYRMWRFYLLSCAATFRARRNQLWQIVFSKGGVGTYQSIR